MLPIEQKWHEWIDNFYRCRQVQGSYGVKTLSTEEMWCSQMVSSPSDCGDSGSQVRIYSIFTPMERLRIERNPTPDPISWNRQKNVFCSWTRSPVYYMPCCGAGPFSVDSGSGLWLRLRRQVQKGQFECCCFFRRLLNMGTFFSLDLSTIAQRKGKEFF